MGETGHVNADGIEEPTKVKRGGVTFNRGVCRQDDLLNVAILEAS